MKPIPEQALQQHLAVLGKTGSGKTSTAKLAVEQVAAEGARVLVLDPIKSDWWGLTSSADGKRPGLPFQILGGPHGHVPLHSAAGKAIGELVGRGDLRQAIIDMADFEPGGQLKFFVDFAPALLRSMRGIVYLVIEEAHLFAPKERSGMGSEQLAIHWAKTIATAGRSKGIRLMVLSQRTQALHNAVLGSCDTLIAHRFTAPADQEPVLKWLKANVDAKVYREVADSLSSLRTGEGWICSGEAQLFERRQFPRIHTYDNSATPTEDSHRVDVATAPVDRAALIAILGNAVKEAEENDPELLKAEIARLRKLKGSEASEASAEDLNMARSEGWREGVAHGRGEIARGVVETFGRIETLASSIAEAACAARLEATALDERGQIPAAAPTVRIPQSVNRPSLPKARSVNQAPSGKMSGPQQRILDGLAWLKGLGIDRADRVRAAMLADQSPRSSGYEKNVGTLKTAGLIDYPGPGELSLTPAGEDAAAAPNVPLTDAALHAVIRQHVSGPQWRILDTLIRAYPRSLDRASLASRAEASVKSSGFEKNIGTLRSLGFIDYPGAGQVIALPSLFVRGARK